MERGIHHDQAVRLCSDALANGGERLSQARVRWELAGDCTAPKVFERFGRPEAMESGEEVLARVLTGEGDGFDSEGGVFRLRRLKYHLRLARRAHILILELHTRCRKCDNCRKVRQRTWAARARAELSASARTWFGTITLSPEEHHRFLTAARKRLGDQGIDFDGLPFGEQFTERHREISGELTKYLKRVRKESGAPLRYMLVAEQHQSGAPHYHLLVHEQDVGLPVRHAVLSGQWKRGFTNFKLVSEPHQATYLCKYLGKSSVARVRASARYGAPGPPLAEARA